MTVRPRSGGLLVFGPDVEELGLAVRVEDGKEVDEPGPLRPFKFISTVGNSDVVRFIKDKFKDGENSVTVWST